MDASDRPLIIVVNDDTAFLQLMEQLLEDEGYEAEVMKSTKNALEHIKERRPALIVLDLVMRGMDGFEVLDRLKADPLLRQIPILIRSSKTLDAEERKSLGSAVAVITKDESTKEELLGIVDKVIMASRKAP
jgi:CheY-like chemotaxis protein